MGRGTSPAPLSFPPQGEKGSGGPLGFPGPKVSAGAAGVASGARAALCFAVPVGKKTERVRGPSCRLWLLSL